MRRLKKLALGLGLTSALGLAACSSSSTQQALEPAISTCNPLNSTLQFVVGTANVAGTVGLNTLATLRQNAGGACIAGASLLDDAPTITGPAGFVVPGTADAGADAGTASISGTLVTSLVNAPPTTTFNPGSSGQFPANPGIVSAYGILPAAVTNSQGGTNAGQGGLNTTPYAIPFYSSTQLTYIGGPPAFVPPSDAGGTHTSTRDGSFPAGYLGYTLGFVSFAVAPVSGAYKLNVVIPTGQNLQSGASGTGTETQSATLSNTSGLATWGAAPAFVSDGNGGGTVTLNFAGGAGLSEEYVEVVDEGPGGAVGAPAKAGSACAALGTHYPIYYTFQVSPGTATVAVPDNIGPAAPGKTQGHTLCTAADNGGTAGGDVVAVYGFATDYPVKSTAFPASAGNPSPLNSITGQADVTLSPAATGTE